MARTIAIANDKGGVGKTTIAINIGAALSEQGKRVLLVDLDPQFDATTGVGLEPHGNGALQTVYDLLLTPGTNPNTVIHTTHINGLALMPASEKLKAAEDQLGRIVGAEKLLHEALSVLTGYDYVLLDTPRGLGRLTLNALSAATHVIVPVQIGKWSLKGTKPLFETIDAVRKRINPSLHVLGVVVTFYDERTAVSKALLSKIQSTYGDLVLRTLIKRATKVDEAALADTPVVLYAARSPVAQAFRELAQEIDQR